MAPDTFFFRWVNTRDNYDDIQEDLRQTDDWPM